jgi:hypothetical protein
VKVVVSSGELLEEVNSDDRKDDKEHDEGGIVEIVNAVDVFLHQDNITLLLFMLLLVGLLMHILHYCELLQLDVVDAAEEQVADHIGDGDGCDIGDYSDPDYHGRH